MTTEVPSLPWRRKEGLSAVALAKEGAPTLLDGDFDHVAAQV